jgi:hypothetical protein
MDVLPIYQEATVGESLSVDVYVQNVIDLGGYSFVIDWDPGVLAFTGVSNGSFLGSTGRTVTCLPPVVLLSSVSFSCTTLGLPAGPSGSDVIATLDFSAVGEGDSPVAFSAAGASDSLGLPMAPVTADATVHVDEVEPVSLTLSSSGDAPVLAGNPAGNFGTHPNLFVNGDNSALKRSFTLFDVSSIPIGSTIIQATLDLCAVSIPSSGAVGHTYELRQPLAAWDEMTLTWNNQPAVGGVSDTIIVPSSVTCVTFDVTGDLQSFVNGSSNFGWRVSDADESSGNNSQTTFGSRDGDRPDVPHMDVTYLPP